MHDDPWHFDLPPASIAQQPASRRADSRLLLVRPGAGPAGEHRFDALPRLLRRGDLLVLNESRVLPARLRTLRTDTGGRVEVLLVAPDGAPAAWTALARPARRLRPGVRLTVLAPGADAPAPGAPELEVRARADDGSVTVAGPGDLADLAAEHGEMPLPPYIRRTPDDPRRDADRERYQTVYAGGEARSVAAPTAGLHFSADVLAALDAAGVGTARVTLHVGPGTFQPPTADQVARRRLHAEHFRLPAATARRLAATRAAGGRVVAVGTTSLRVLETVHRLALPAVPDRPRRWDDAAGVFTGTARPGDGAWEVTGATRLFVAPPDRVAACDGLLTNFHLPGSSLLMLVAALVGDPAWRRTYDHAVTAGLRFYSYGDCMLVLPATGGAP